MVVGDITFSVFKPITGVKLIDVTMRALVPIMLLYRLQKPLSKVVLTIWKVIMVIEPLISTGAQHIPVLTLRAVSKRLPTMRLGATAVIVPMTLPVSYCDVGTRDLGNGLLGDLLWGGEGVILRARSDLNTSLAGGLFLAALPLPSIRLALFPGHVLERLAINRSTPGVRRLCSALACAGLVVPQRLGQIRAPTAPRYTDRPSPADSFLSSMSPLSREPGYSEETGSSRIVGWVGRRLTHHPCSDRNQTIDGGFRPSTHPDFWQETEVVGKSE